MHAAKSNCPMPGVVNGTWLVALRGVKRMIQLFLAGYGLVLLLIFYSPVADFFVRPLWIAPDVRAAQAMVVLTAYATNDGILNEAAMRRAQMAARLYHDRLSPLVIISGGPPHGSPERHTADFMADFMAQLGVPRSAMLLEKQSADTHTSAVEVAALCRSRGIQRVLLVTNAAHMRRALAAFEAQHVTVSPVPADPWTLTWESPQDRLRKFDAALHEYAGLLYYRWRGWI